MKLFLIAVHLFSIVWIWKAWRQWTNFQLSNGLFLLFVGFLLVANVSPYFGPQLDVVAQFFGIDLAVRAAFYISIIMLFVLVKHLNRRVVHQQRSLARLARAIALEKFQTTYLPEAEGSPK